MVVVVKEYKLSKMISEVEINQIPIR
jgi:hypothetical protein